MNKFIFALCAVVCCLYFSESYADVYTVQVYADGIIRNRADGDSPGMYERKAKIFGSCEELGHGIEKGW